MRTLIVVSAILLFAVSCSSEPENDSWHYRQYAIDGKIIDFCNVKKNTSGDLVVLYNGPKTSMVILEYYKENDCYNYLTHQPPGMWKPTHMITAITGEVLIYESVSEAYPKFEFEAMPNEWRQ